MVEELKWEVERNRKEFERLESEEARRWVRECGWCVWPSDD